MHPFAERFASAWGDPTADRLVNLLTDDVVLRQPHRPPIRGKAAARAELKHLLDCVPAVYGEVERGLGEDQAVFIEWRMRFRGLDRAVSMVDRFLLRDGLGSERTVWFDQLALFGLVAGHPRLWRGFARYQFARPAAA